MEALRPYVEGMQNHTDQVNFRPEARCSQAHRMLRRLGSWHAMLIAAFKENQADLVAHVQSYLGLDNGDSSGAACGVFVDQPNPDSHWFHPLSQEQRCGVRRSAGYVFCAAHLPNPMRRLPIPPDTGSLAFG